jgi:hypothetical protein
MTNIQKHLLMGRREFEKELMHRSLLDYSNYFTKRCIGVSIAVLAASRAVFFTMDRYVHPEPDMVTKIIVSAAASCLGYLVVQSGLQLYYQRFLRKERVDHVSESAESKARRHAHEKLSAVLRISLSPNPEKHHRHNIVSTARKIAEDPESADLTLDLYHARKRILSLRGIPMEVLDRGDMVRERLTRRHIRAGVST